MTKSLELEPPLAFRRWFADLSNGYLSLYNTMASWRSGAAPQLIMPLDKVSVERQRAHKCGCWCSCILARLLIGRVVLLACYMRAAGRSRHPPNRPASTCTRGTYRRVQDDALRATNLSHILCSCCSTRTRTLTARKNQRFMAYRFRYDWQASVAQSAE